MNLADIVGSKVVIHPDMLMIPVFRKLWESDSDDKVYATNVISYIVLKNKYDSPYLLSMSRENIEPTLKKEIFGDANYKLSLEEIIVEKGYISFINTKLLQMLNNMRLKLDTISDYYKNSLEDTLDEKKIKDLLAGMTSVGNVFKSVDFLEKAVKSEELSTTKIQGGTELNPYELPKQ